MEAFFRQLPAVAVFFFRPGGNDAVLAQQVGEFQGELAAFAASLGVRYATCSGLIPSGAATTGDSLATRLSESELEDILRAAVDTAQGLNMELDFTSPGWLPEESRWR